MPSRPTNHITPSTERKNERERERAVSRLKERLLYFIVTWFSDAIVNRYAVRTKERGVFSVNKVEREREREKRRGKIADN